MPSRSVKLVSPDGSEMAHLERYQDLRITTPGSRSRSAGLYEVLLVRGPDAKEPQPVDRSARRVSHAKHCASPILMGVRTHEHTTCTTPASLHSPLVPCSDSSWVLLLLMNCSLVTGYQHEHPEYRVSFTLEGREYRRCAVFSTLLLTCFVVMSTRSSGHGSIDPPLWISWCRM